MDRSSDELQRERRLAPRARLETQATVHMLNQELTCHTRDLSADGLALLSLDGSVPSGTFMKVHLKLPDEREALDLDGILVRTDPLSTGIVWGLRFLECEANAQTKIERYVSARASRHMAAGSTSRPGEGFTSVGGHSTTIGEMPPDPLAATEKDEDS